MKTSVHSVEQKSIGLKFSKSRTGSDVRYSCYHNSSLLLSPYLRIRGVSLSSIHYNQSYRVYTGCPGGNVPDFGKMFLKIKYTDITKNTHIQN